MGLLAAILLLEIGPMITLIRWRVQVGRGQPPDTHTAARLSRISVLQAVLVVLMVLAATAMARGYGVAAS
jgi:putative membrane protein